MEKVFRCYVEKRPGFDGAARALCRELTEELGISSLTGGRILNRYDVEGVSPQWMIFMRRTLTQKAETYFP